MEKLQAPSSNLQTIRKSSHFQGCLHEIRCKCLGFQDQVRDLLNVEGRLKTVKVCPASFPPCSRPCVGISRVFFLEMVAASHALW